MSKLIQENVNTILWKAGEPYRGIIPAHIYKDYVLALFFLKCVSNQKTKANIGEIKIDLSSSFNHIYSERYSDNYGDVINNVFKSFGSLNQEKLNGAFDYLDYNFSENEMLKSMVEEINLINIIDFSLENRNILVNSLLYIIEAFEYEVGKKNGSNFTPNEIAELMVELLNPKQGNSIYDPDCGIGNLLTTAFHKADGVNITGQVEEKSLFMLSKINMILSGVLDRNLKNENSINNPLLSTNNQLKTFDIVLSNPSDFSKGWATLNKKKRFGDSYNIFNLGMPPLNRPEFVYILHMINSMNKDGKMAVIAIPSLLFRGGIEEDIRKNLIEKNLLDGIINLPKNIFPGTGLSLSILLFKNNRDKDDLIMIDASSKDYLIMERSKYKINQNIIEKIVNVYREYNEIKSFSRIVKLSEIIENDYNLFIPRYLSIVDKDKQRSSNEIRNNIIKIQADLLKVEKDIENTIDKL